MKNKLYRAGLLPYVIEDGVIKFMLMKPADTDRGGDSFQIAKGKIEAGETADDAAIREAEEELGLIRTNMKSFRFLGNYLGRTSIFIAEIQDKTRFLSPHFETGETAWMTLSQFGETGRSLHLDIIQDATRLIFSSDGKIL